MKKMKKSLCDIICIKLPKGRGATIREGATIRGGASIREGATIRGVLQLERGYS